MAAALTPLVSTTEAAAQEEPDGPRFRGGIELGIGVEVPSSLVGNTALGATLLRGQLGAQVNDHWGIWATPALGGVFGGGLSGPAGSFGLMADYTVDGAPMGVGVGAEVGLFAYGGSGGLPDGFALYVGGVVRGSWYPAVTHHEHGVGREALAIGIDLHIDAGAVFMASAATGGTSSNFLIAPIAFVGYQAF